MLVNVPHLTLVIFRKRLHLICGAPPEKVESLSSIASGWRGFQVLKKPKLRSSLDLVVFV